MIPGIVAHALTAATDPPSYVQMWSDRKFGANNAYVSISGQTSGNLLILLGGNATYAKNPYIVESGWTKIFEGDQTDGTMAAWYKISDGTETSATYRFSSPNCNTAAAVFEFSGAAYDTFSTPATGTGTSSDANGLTTSESNCKVLHCSLQINASSPTHTPPTGYTERWDLNVDSAQHWFSITMSDKDYSSSGSTGTVSGTWSQNDGWIAALISLKPG